MSEVETTSFEECLQRLIDSLEASSYEGVRVQIAEMYPAEVARLIEALTPNLRISLLNVIEHSIQGQILTELNEDVKIQLLSEMETNSIVKATEGLDMDDLADIVPNLPESALHNLLLTLDYKHREHLKQVLSFPEDSAGGLMNTDIITIRPDVKLRSVIRYLRLLGEVPQDTDQIFVVDRSFKFLGSITLSTILTNEPELMVEPLMEDNIPAINSETNSKDVVTLFQDRNLISAPVIDEKGELIGRITIDDVVDVIREDAEQSVLSMAGLDQDEDVFAPVFQSTKRRSIWLGVNLITAFIAVFFIGLFETTLQNTIALAILMPIVASMGGIAGTQTLILATRGIATGKVTNSNLKTLTSKEMAVGLFNGCLWAIVIGFLTFLWFENQQIAWIIGFAVVVNLIFAALSGAVLPSLLTKLNIDPALAGGVILTTITDVIGFVAFLGVASLVI